MKGSSHLLCHVIQNLFDIDLSQPFPPPSATPFSAFGGILLPLHAMTERLSLQAASRNKLEDMKINNPYNQLEEHNCFGCAKRNPIGLRLDFELKDDLVTAKWTPTKDYQGFNNVLHGGISATLLDEVAFWAVQAFLDTNGVTSHINATYLKPVMISKGDITVTAHCKGECGKHEYLFETQLFDGNGALCVEADIAYFVYPQEIAKHKLHYPGKQALGLAEE